MEDTRLPLEEPAQPGFFSNKRNLILVALAVGGAAGLVMFLSRRSAAPETGAAIDTTHPYSQTDIQLGNLATQLSQFRGDTAVQNADLSTLITGGFGNLNAHVDETTGGISDSIAANQTYNVALFTDLWHLLSAVSSNVGNIATNQGVYANTFAGQIANVADNQVTIQAGQNSTWQGLWDYFNSHSDEHVSSPFNQITLPYGSEIKAGGGMSIGLPHIEQQRIGAGGYDGSQIVESTYDAGNGDPTEWLNLMANGPVRYVGVIA